jgi:hypothetical protein
MTGKIWESTPPTTRLHPSGTNRRAEHRQHQQSTAANIIDPSNGSYFLRSINT